MDSVDPDVVHPRWSLRERSLAVLGLALCAVAIGWGFATLLTYQSTAGEQGTAPARWPSSTTFTLARDRPTLLLFAHPRCPCTRASLRALERVMTRQPDLGAEVLLWCAEEVSEDWARGEFWERAASIPGVGVRVDLGGRVAATFGARTSGQVVLYAADGRLLFQGGLTPARGHEGDSDALATLLTAASSGLAARRPAAVFGCALGWGDDEGAARP